MMVVIVVEAFPKGFFEVEMEETEAGVKVEKLVRVVAARTAMATVVMLFSWASYHALKKSQEIRSRLKKNFI